MGFLRPEHYINEAAYKVEPELKDVSKIIKECEEIADKYEVEPLGDIGCPIPPEIEL